MQGHNVREFDICTSKLCHRDVQWCGKRKIAVVSRQIKGHIDTQLRCCGTLVSLVKLRCVASSLVNEEADTAPYFCSEY